MSVYEINDFERADELVEEKPYSEKTLMDIVLEVKWGEYAKVKTYCSEYYTFNHHHGLISLFNLPEFVDATKITDYYNEFVLPIIEELNGYFYTKWDGNNFVGKFDIPDDRENIWDELNDVLNDAPTFDVQVYESFGDLLAGEIETTLNEMNINILDVKPDDMDLHERIYDYVIHADEPDTYYYVFGDAYQDIENMLIDLQEERQED